MKTMHGTLSAVLSAAILIAGLPPAALGASGAGSRARTGAGPRRIHPFLRGPARRLPGRTAAPALPPSLLRPAAEARKGALAARNQTLGWRERSPLLSAEPYPAGNSRLGAAAGSVRGAARRVMRELSWESRRAGALPSTAALAAAPGDEGGRNPASPRRFLDKRSYDYPRMFDMTRRLLTRPAVGKFLKEVFAEELTVSEEFQKKYDMPDRIKEVSESQFMLLLQHNPQHWGLLEDYLKDVEKEDKKEAVDAEVHKEWRARFRELLKDEELRGTFLKLNDPLEPMPLLPADGRPGYRDATVHFNHQVKRAGGLVPAEDLKQVLIDFINGARKKIMFNVFDFDRLDVADALVARAKAGVAVTGGIDKNILDSRPEVKAVFDKLNAQKGVSIHAVDPVGLNHQKIVIRDFDDPEAAASLFSSGNFTQSCIGPEGDLVCVPAEDRPKDSLPNANHMLIVKGILIAQTAANSLIKTLLYKLRGREYPLGGGFKVFGEAPAPGGEPPYMVPIYSPKGGLGDVNRDLTQRLILGTRGPLWTMHFVASSPTFEAAIIERARLEKAEGRDFDFRSLSDTSFAMRSYSVSLHLSGLELKEDEKAKEYVEAAENPLSEILGKKKYEALRDNIRVAPRAFRGHVYTDAEGRKTEYAAKLHHKVLRSGDFAVLGTSFNFSEAANSNQEQYILTNDPLLVEAVAGGFEGLSAMGATPLHEEAARRNRFFREAGQEDDLNIGARYRHDDEEAARSRRKAPK